MTRYETSRCAGRGLCACGWCRCTNIFASAATISSGAVVAGAAGAADAQAGRAAVRELVHGTERLLALRHLPASWLGETEPTGGGEADLAQRLAAAEAECGAQLDALRNVVDALPHEVVSHAAGRRPSRRRRRSIIIISSTTTTTTTTTSTAGSACTATRAMPVSWACQANPSSAHVFAAGGRLFYGSRPRQPWCRHHSRSSSQRSLPSATVCARCAHVVADYPPCAVTLVVLPRSASGWRSGNRTKERWGQGSAG
eukprot:COSAG01_NODE_2889_length_6907_cov_43.104877_5_plen_256_part_00